LGIGGLTLTNSNNHYLKEIAVELGLTRPTEHKSNNFYLKKIYELSDEISDESIKEDLLR